MGTMSVQTFLRRRIPQAPIAIAVLSLSALIFGGLTLAQEPSELIGQVKLQGRTDHSGARILVDGAVLGMTSPDGSWKIAYAISGPHQIEITMPGFLSARAVITPVITGGVPAVYDAGLVELKAGDINGDGQIDMVDVKRIGSVQAPYLPGDPVLDLNGDNFVDIRDLSIASANIGHKMSTFSLTLRRKGVRPTLTVRPTSAIRPMPTIGSREPAIMPKWLSWRLVVLLALLLSMSIITAGAMRIEKALRDIRSKDPEREMLAWVESVRSLEGALLQLRVPDLNTGELLKELEDVRKERTRMELL